MANNYQILSEDAIKYLCGLIRDLASVSEGIDNINLADDKTFSNIYIKNLIDKCLEDANAEAEKLVGALTHLTCEETAIQPTLDNSEINVIYLYSANGNPPYQQFLKISEDKLVDLGSTSISLEDYIKAADVAKDYATKVELKAVTDKIGTTTLTTTDTTITGAIEEVKGIADGKVDKTSIVTALGDSVTDDQVTSALLTKTELGKINDSLVDISRMKIYTNVKQLGLESECSTVDIFKAMPNNSLAIIGTFPIVSDEYCKLIDKPIKSYEGLLTIVKFNHARFSIEYKLSGGTEKYPNIMYVGNFAGSEPTTIDWQELATMDKIGSTDISTIGDGTVTGAISSMNSNFDYSFGTVTMDSNITSYVSYEKYGKFVHIKGLFVVNTAIAKDGIIITLPFESLTGHGIFLREKAGSGKQCAFTSTTINVVDTELSVGTYDIDTWYIAK